jgi:hypothetical protein
MSKSPIKKNELEELTQKLHVGLASELLDRLNSGEATTQDLNVIRQFLKDNNINGVPISDDEVSGTQGNALGRLVDSLPFPKSSILLK